MRILTILALSLPLLPTIPSSASAEPLTPAKPLFNTPVVEPAQPKRSVRPTNPIPRRDQQAAYVTNVGARRVRDDSAAVLDDLATAVAHPVRWFDITRLLPEFGVVATVEMPPGHVLSRLVIASTPAVTA